MFKTNETKDRVSYGNLLLPPDGYTLNFAVGTTYSLDLEALTAVCISLGLAEDTDSTLPFISGLCAASPCCCTYA